VITVRHEELSRRIAEVDAQIAAHPLSSEPVTQAHAVIEAHGSTDDSDAISRELASRGLPSLVELGRIQARSSFSWWRLHRKRRALLRRADR